MTRKTKRILKGAVAGLAGGLAGTYAMTEFQEWWSKASNKRNSAGSRSSEPATVKAAELISEKILHRRLLNRDKDRAGELVHYAFGTLNGAAYGALAEKSPIARAAGGTLFGAVLFVVADETLAPLLRFSRPPHKYPLRSHLYGLASHMVYSVTTNAVRGLLRGAMV